MSYLLDTNAISEAGKTRPNAGLSAWLASQDRDELWISVLTIGELRYGMLVLPAGLRRDTLYAWITQIELAYASRTLGVDTGVATAWAEVAARHRAALRTISATDELIAATAIVHDLTVVTRNTRDFQFSGCRMTSPWT